MAEEEKEEEETMEPVVETEVIAHEDGPSLIAVEEQIGVEVVELLREVRMKMRLLERR